MGTVKITESKNQRKQMRPARNRPCNWPLPPSPFLVIPFAASPPTPLLLAMLSWKERPTTTKQQNAQLAHSELVFLDWYASGSSVELIIGKMQKSVSARCLHFHCAFPFFAMKQRRSICSPPVSLFSAPACFIFRCEAKARSMSGPRT